ncbi:unnamed protein product [Diabrotica balteata]|uniref:Uncharacterized protein n=1 Tax=Diabrotica balteata TaxID=107213 RepID=A0A9N9T851_DIABA|nr:unnamed protein product [Diabrotica balteata]
MKSLFALGLASILITVCVANQKYTTKYDNVDIDAIIKNERLLKNYFNCLMDEGPCNADGKELKKVLPDALKTECAKCSDAQKNGAKKIITHLIKNKRQWWDELEARFDADHSYAKSHEKELKELGIEL